MNYLVSGARRSILAVLLALTVAFGPATWSAASAAEQDKRPGSTVVGKSTHGKITSKVVGRASDGSKVTGSFTPDRVVKRKGKLAMRGFLKGVMTDDAGRKTHFSGIKVIPIKKVAGTKLTDRRALKSKATCEILTLVLGPLDLNLLGLRVQLNRVVLDITAESGPGNLLGNLLCAVAGLLDGSPLTGLLGQLRTLLNQILGLLNLGV